jgi:hypothetical protein
MPNETGEPNEPSNPEGAPGTGLVVRSDGAYTKELVDEIVGKSLTTRTDGTGVVQSDVEEPRRIRRGRFFLSYYDQTTFGSLSRPIFEHWGHRVVVGDQIPDAERGGMWCYASHGDFALIDESTPPTDWPEYRRAADGWVRVEPIVERLPQFNLDRLMKSVTEVKRIK